jgi:hypothetical protein
VAWAPELTSDVLELHAVDHTTYPTIALMPTINPVLRSARFFLNGYHHIILSKGDQCVQMRFRGRLDLHHTKLVTAVFMERAHLRDRLRAISALNHMHDARVYESPFVAPDNRSQRLDFVLHALDGKLAGCTNREIAISLFGRQRVEAAWTDPGEYLQDQVRRAIRRGRYLMGGGYRSLLK